MPREALLTYPQLNRGARQICRYAGLVIARPDVAACGYASFRIGSPLSHASMSSTIWL